jgi:hypothetical protein
LNLSGSDFIQEEILMRHTVIFKRFTLAILIMMAPFVVTQGKAESKSHSGIVLETIDAANYIYMNIDESGNKYWIAAPHMSIDKGTHVNFTEQLEMTDFTSKALDRTFDRLLFVGKVHIESTSENTTADAPTPTPEAAAEEPVAISVPPEYIYEDAEKYTIEEIYSKKDEIKGKPVEVSGEVVKVNENILGKSWVHIKDGTGTENNNKLVFTSDNDTTTVGSEVTAKGIADTDKDFGSGYFYPVIIEKSNFSQ